MVYGSTLFNTHEILADRCVPPLRNLVAPPDATTVEGVPFRLVKLTPTFGL